MTMMTQIVAGDVNFISPRNTDLLKFATMMGIGSVMQSTPQMAHSEATSLPGESNQFENIS